MLGKGLARLESSQSSPQLLYACCVFIKGCRYRVMWKVRLSLSCCTVARFHPASGWWGCWTWRTSWRVLWGSVWLLRPVMQNNRGKINKKQDTTVSETTHLFNNKTFSTVQKGKHTYVRTQSVCTQPQGCIFFTDVGNLFIINVKVSRSEARGSSLSFLSLYKTSQQLPITLLEKEHLEEYTLLGTRWKDNAHLDLTQFQKQEGTHKINTNHFNSGKKG